MKYIEKYPIFIVVIFTLSIFIKPAFCFFMLGSIISFTSIEMIVFLKRIQIEGIECIGKVIEYQSDDDGYKTPLVEFTTIPGDHILEKPFVYVSTDLSKIRSYKSMINQSVSVLYDQDNPKKFIIAGEKESNYFFLFFSFLIGLGFVIISICSFLGYIKMG